MEIVCAADPNQIYTRDGRWTFDPPHKVYEHRYRFLWADLLGDQSHGNLGNVIESVPGVPGQAAQQRHFLQDDEALNSLCSRLNEFVNLTYQFIMYTDSRQYIAIPWLEFVHRFQVPDVD